MRGRLLGLQRREEETVVTPEDEERWVLREPDSELRRLSYHRIETHRRTWYEGRPNEP